MRGSWNLCGWNSFGEGFRSFKHSVEIVDGANSRGDAERAVVLTGTAMTGRGNLFGGPWQGEGIGGSGRFLRGERASTRLRRGHDATRIWTAMLRFTNQAEWIPEQIWEQAEPTRAGSCSGGQGARPLAWSHGAISAARGFGAEEKRNCGAPAVVADHF